MKYKIGLIFSKRDYVYNLDNYGKRYNLLFITGMVGSGKTTLSKKIANEENAIILSEDWLTWSEVYKNDKLAMKILNKFYKKCPQAKEAAINNLWHKQLLSNEEQRKIRTEYNKFLIDYTLKNQKKLFIIEGIDVYRIIDLKDIANKGIIIKGTSVIKCFIRRYKRDKTIDNQLNLKNKFKYIMMVIKESKIFYFKERKILNNYIAKFNNNYL